MEKKDYLNQFSSRLIMQFMNKQQEKGLKKYGRLADEASDELPAMEIAKHALEEAVDGAFYASMLLQKLDTSVLIFDDIVEALASHLEKYENDGFFDDEDLAYDLKKIVNEYKAQRGCEDDE